MALNSYNISDPSDDGNIYFREWDEMKRFFVVCAFVLLIATSAFAGSTAELKGKLTVTIDGQDTAISGVGEVELPEPYSLETQDDDPMLLAGILKDELSEEASITVKTSKSFTIGGDEVTGVFVIKEAKNEFGNVGDLLLPVDEKAGENGPWTVPAESGDYYIGVIPDHESEDAAVLCFIKMAVK